MERLRREIAQSWEVNLWDWEAHHRNLTGALLRFSDQELIDAKQCLSDRSAAIYRIDTWIASHLFTEGMMSDDGFLDLIDCIIATPHYDSIRESADALADLPEFAGYTEICFSNIPVELFDRRKKVPPYTHLIYEFIAQPSFPSFPRFDRELAKKLVPRLYESFGAFVEWQTKIDTELGADGRT